MKPLKSLFLGDYQSFSNKKDYKIFFITNLFLIFGATVHIIYAGIFFYLRIHPMVFIEFLSVVALTTAALINRKKIRYVPAMIMCIEIGANGVLWSMVLKAEVSHYLYTFVALLAAFLFLELRKSQKVFLVIFLLICVNVSHSEQNVRDIYLTGENIEWLSFISLNMVFILLTVELTINEIAGEAIKEIYKKTVNMITDEMMHDSLTKLYNRRYFQENEEDLNNSAEEREFCVAMLDIDHFKAINDTYGHDTGDAVIRLFAEKMHNVLSESDVIMRWGGEEFVVLFQDADMEDAYRELYKFRDTIKSVGIRRGNETVKFTFTAGIAKAESGMTVSEAITQADKIMYDGKVLGRDRICCEQKVSSKPLGK